MYHLWWFGADYGDTFMPRTDYRLADKDNKPIGRDVYTIFHNIYVPLRELCRHYDGYGHAEINPNECPALVIPPGFFENDIKIRYGLDPYHQDCVNIAPWKQYYSLLDKSNGTDYKWVLSDIPLFWKDRISKVEKFKSDNEPLYNVVMTKSRNEAMWILANSKAKTDNEGSLDKELIMSIAEKPVAFKEGTCAV